MIEVSIIEFESGWGQRVDGTKKFNTIEDADKFVKEYNKNNNKETVPDWYMYATISNYRA